PVAPAIQASAPRSVRSDNRQNQQTGRAAPVRSGVPPAGGLGSRYPVGPRGGLLRARPIVTGIYGTRRPNRTARAHGGAQPRRGAGAAPDRRSGTRDVRSDHRDEAK